MAYYVRQDGSRLTEAEATKVVFVPPGFSPAHPRGAFVDADGKQVTKFLDTWEGLDPFGRPAQTGYTVVDLTPALKAQLQRIEDRLGTLS